MSDVPPIRALLFDFDGLIVDTETPSYESWNEIYREHGHELDVNQWADVLSNRESTFDALANLQALLGDDVRLDAVDLDDRRSRRKDQLTDVAELLPGIHQYVSEARATGLKLGIASGSSREWVMRHLERLGIDEGWDCMRTRDDTPRSKPHPDPYISLLECLGVAAAEAIALEDSPNGITSARAAGIFCVAVPNSLTRQLDLSHADLTIESLQDLPLADLVRRAGQRGGQE
jgi:HAD superfamily hydrolase (TIGR01509 family)